jgi:hypothetical protein
MFTGVKITTIFVQIKWTFKLYTLFSCAYLATDWGVVLLGILSDFQS